MRFPIPEEYKVVYSHITGISMRPPKDENYPVLTHVTQARIYAPDSEAPLAIGVAIQNPDDQHCRRIGRDVARGRAAKALAETLAVKTGPPFDNSWDPGDRYDPLG